MTLELIITIFTLGIVLFIVINQYKKTKNKLTTEIEKSNKLNSDLEKYSRIISIENEIELKNKTSLLQNYFLIHYAIFAY
ncbi:MAG: cellulose synthase/poly-beta-1,6-N-acetylglucosamine synthase-like glycosyltransferase [Flavobacteriaceae bacterium]|jgi:cellulose synthase/poly-beta-1,6-N-acetylglucosamine synthase-like glycosyltransferase